MKNTLFYLLLCGIAEIAYGQTDTLTPQDLQTVVVTGTRTEKLLADVPIPITIISQKQIQQIGSLRLQDILQEQTGLAVQNNHGNGIQIQGMNPDYTLILIDGEPLIGRVAGTVELSRLAVGNIKRIEIVKGPSSSLYGSEALAGVINIITEKPNTTKLSLSSRYGTNQTTDFGLNTSFCKNKWGISLFANRYSTQGYDLTPDIFGQTVAPYHNYTIQTKISYEHTPQLKFQCMGRLFVERQYNSFDVGTSQKPIYIDDVGKIQDYNLNPTAEWKITEKWKIQGRLYYSMYKTNAEQHYIANQKLFDESFFLQNFFRTEAQIVYGLNDKNTLTAGAGKIWEDVQATRYVGKKKFTTNYVFAQYEALPTQRLHFIVGGRLDNHSVYGTQLSPKASIQYEITPKIALRASIGRGFKAPDFRQLYLNFTNSIAGYSVFGTEELPTALANLQNQHQIAEILLNPAAAGKLKTESSWAYNIGAKINPTQKIQIDVNLFRNDIQNLIETQVFARQVNGQNIFSYKNLNRIFTQGAEIDIAYQLHKNFSLSVGYQWLQAKDKDVIQQIKNGNIFQRNTLTLVTKRITKNDYGGLFGRSQDMLNFKIFYNNKIKKISANIRAIYKGKYGISDNNGNLILDEDSEYVKGYIVYNVSVSKLLWKAKLSTQIGIDNILNKRDTQNIPNIAGRLLWASIQYNIK